jgi:hypothetical protein
MIDYKIIDNFLPKQEFEKIKEVIMSNTFPWFYNKEVSYVGASDGFYFLHNFFESANVSMYFNILTPILNKLDIKAIIKIKGNLYPKTSIIEEHKKHVDCCFSHKGFLFYINNNNGFTRLDDGTKIESVENRGLFFDGGIQHNSSTCTNERVRVNINFNYF